MWTQLRTIIESLADGIVIVDRTGMIRFANPAASRLFNKTPEELIGTPLGIPVVGGETTEMEIVRRGGGDIVYAELRVVDTQWEGDAVELVSLRDITDRKYAEERSRQLAHEREARLEAEAGSRAKSDFLAIMSHELRTPLNAILGYSELIELGISGDLSPTVQDQIGRIRRAARHLLGLVNDILDLAKVEAGRLTVANAPAMAQDAVATALSLIQPQAATRNLSLVISPAIAQLPAYVGDDERVRQILVNLLSNAVKCTEPGGVITIDGEVTATPDARARLQPRAAHLRLTVTDTGSGIAKERLVAIFEPFVQSDSGTTRTREGSGLGLTIGLRLARAMGGDLTVESTLGKGSSFSLWLPSDPATVATRQGDAPLTIMEMAGVASSATRADALPRDLKGLSEVSRDMRSQIGALVDIVVGRIRSDAQMPMAAGLRTSQVADHLTTLLADITAALLVVEEMNGVASPLLADAVEIQRLVAELHGAQRARLGWKEVALRREFMIIREEVERVVRRSVPTHGSLEPGDVADIVNRFVDRAEYLSVRAMERVRVE